MQQAVERCRFDDSGEDKGWDAVVVAIESALVLREARVAATVS
jgi:6,7-dimethyl-8-ribityllumazine synthase